MSALRSILVIGLLLTASGFASEALGGYLGPMEYTGYLVFSYPEGENPINNIVFTVDSRIANNLLLVNVPSPWSHSYSGGILTLTGGSLSPGGTVQVAVSLNKYFDEGEYSVSSVGTTTAGESSNSQGTLHVGNLVILRALQMLSDYSLPIAGLTGALTALEVVLTNRKRQDDTKVSTEKEEPKTCQELLDECERAKAAAEAAEAAAKTAKENADKAKQDHEKAKQDLEKAQKNLDSINKDSTDDSGSWVEMDGRRITSMDLKLRSDASKALWEQYRNGEIDAKSLEKAWEELGEDDALDELRKKNKDEAEKAVKEAKEKEADAAKKSEEAEQASAEAEKKATEARDYANKICKTADECAKKEAEAKAKETTDKGTDTTPPGPAVVVEEPEKTRERKCREGDREIRQVGRVDRITVNVDFSIIIESTGLYDQEAARQMSLGLSNLAQDLDLAGYLLGGLSSGKTINGGIGALKQGKYVTGGAGLAYGTVTGAMTAAGVTVGTESMDISIPTSGPEVISELLESIAKLGSLVARKVGEWTEHNEIYSVRMVFFRQKMTATPYQIWECQGGEWRCVRKLYEIEVSKLMRGGEPNPKEFKLESKRNRYLFNREIRRSGNIARARIANGMRMRKKFLQEHRAGPCGS